MATVADPINRRALGPNHRPNCDGMRWTHSGSGYNRVRVCVCGAEDHDPTPESLARLCKIARDLGKKDDGRG